MSQEGKKSDTKKIRKKNLITETLTEKIRKTTFYISNNIFISVFQSTRASVKEVNLFFPVLAPIRKLLSWLVSKTAQRNFTSDILLGVRCLYPSLHSLVPPDGPYITTVSSSEVRASWKTHRMSWGEAAHTPRAVTWVALLGNFVTICLLLAFLFFLFFPHRIIL